MSKARNDRSNSLIFQHKRRPCVTKYKKIYFVFTQVYLFVEGRGFHAEGEGTKSRVEGNIFFFPKFFFWEKVIIDAINGIKTNKKNLKNKWRVNIF